MHYDLFYQHLDDKDTLYDDQTIEYLNPKLINVFLMDDITKTNLILDDGTRAQSGSEDNTVVAKIAQ